MILFCSTYVTTDIDSNKYIDTLRYGEHICGRSYDRIIIDTTDVNDIIKESIIRDLQARSFNKVILVENNKQMLLSNIIRDIKLCFYDNYYKEELVNCGQPKLIPFKEVIDIIAKHGGFNK